MKINKIEFQAFGPFKEKVGIDFCKFDNGLFIISGETGAGKTTIFDAISYALYGELTGGYKDSTAIRSLYAREDLLTEVNLYFEANGVSYHIVRRPDQPEVIVPRGKASLKKYTVAFYRIVDGKEEIVIDGENHKDIINKAILDTIKIKYEQFKQIVVLPQGEFLKILNSTAQDKEKLLSAILNVSDYDAIVEKLRGRYNEVNSRVDTYNKQKSSILEGARVSNLEELKTKRDTNKASYEEALKNWKSCNEELVSLRKMLESSKKSNDTFLKLENAKAEYEKHLENKAIQESNLKNLVVLEKAEKVSYFEREYEGSLSRLQVISNELNKNEKDLALLKEKQEGLPRDKETAERLNLELEECKKNIEQKTRINELNLEVNKVFKSKKEAEEAFEAANRQEEIYNLKKEEILKSKKENEDLENKLSLLIRNYDSSYVNKIKETYQLYQDVKENDRKIESKTKDVQKSEEIAQSIYLEVMECKKNWNTMEDAYNLGEISKFSHLVLENKPCPLCGGLDHKNGGLTHPAVSKKDVDDAKRAYEERNNEFQKNKGSLDILKKDLNDLEQNAYAKVDRSLFLTIENDYPSALNSEKAFNENNAKLLNIRRSLQSYQSELEELDNQRNTLNLEEKKSALLKLSTSYEEKLSTYKKEAAKVSESILSMDLEEKKRMLVQDIESVNNRIEYIQKNFTTLTSRKATLEESKETENQKWNEAVSAYKNALVNNDLSEEEYKDYKLGIQKISSLRNEIHSYETKEASLKASIQAFSDELNGRTYVDVIPLEEKIKEETSNLSDYDNLKTLYSNKYTLDEKNIQDYEDISLKVKDDTDLWNVLDKLYRLCNGNYTGYSKISIKRYVLSRLMNEILKYANMHLYEFSDRRYTIHLKETDSISDKGLTFEAFDTQTGQNRCIGNLSGGESFMASLALALGMSECISALNGGIKLDNIFIDEGFGTLDEKSQNDAINTLFELAASTQGAGGKTIGIISHVATVKEQIGRGFNVKKSKSGSTVESL